MVPIYLPGSATPRFEWINAPEAPDDWGEFVDRTCVPRWHEVNVRSPDSVHEWRRLSADYVRELELLEAEWMAYAKSIANIRRSIEDADAITDPQVFELLRAREVEILENSEMLDGFWELIQEEIGEVEGLVAEALEDE